MEASVSFSLKSSYLTKNDPKFGRKCTGIVRASSLQLGFQRGQTVDLANLTRNRGSIKSRNPPLKISCCHKHPAGTEIHNSFDDALVLKRKAQDVLPYLNERCIYLVGMMGSGKTTVGKILSEVLGYSFFDSDKLVEQAVGIPSVAQIFKEHSEAFFRDNESEVLKDLSTMRRLVVATGGGAVIRPLNWKYMKHGISVWLDVPLDALARRIAAVGTASRPLLDKESGDPYTKAFAKLTSLFEQRSDAYPNADVRVCLEDMASKQGLSDVSALTPSAIAIEALLKIEIYLTEKVAARNS
ncbi:Shikimate kinase [Rhynchospora pubera]|uniref:shikimate kinase n=1 Tax=Rhynchospora pubera TaxID=906938 RepID=A0AAV8H861_9POAL|nr:Shikimate kinase [Rhynchospora pubera]